MWRKLWDRLLNLDSHPNLMKVEDVFENSTHYYIVLEKLNGGELFDFLLNERAVPEETCKYVMRQILLSLLHLHKKKLLHRDVKPENLVFRYKRGSAPSKELDQQLVLIDYDTCKMTDYTAADYNEIVDGRRKLVGTYGYLAPEVVRGAEYSAASDIWSVGVILYVLMTGVPPMPMELMTSAKESSKVHQKYQSQGINFQQMPLPEFPAATNLIKMILQFKPENRPSDIIHVLSHPWLFPNDHLYLQLAPVPSEAISLLKRMKHHQQQQQQQQLNQRSNKSTFIEKNFSNNISMQNALIFNTNNYGCNNINNNTNSLVKDVSHLKLASSSNIDNINNNMYNMHINTALSSNKQTSPGTLVSPPRIPAKTSSSLTPNETAPIGSNSAISTIPNPPSSTHAVTATAAYMNKKNMDHENASSINYVSSNNSISTSCPSAVRPPPIHTAAIPPPVSSPSLSTISSPSHECQFVNFIGDNSNGFLKSNGNYNYHFNNQNINGVQMATTMSSSPQHTNQYNSTKNNINNNNNNNSNINKLNRRSDGNLFPATAYQEAQRLLEGRSPSHSLVTILDNSNASISALTSPSCERSPCERSPFSSPQSFRPGTIPSSLRLQQQSVAACLPSNYGSLNSHSSHKPNYVSPVTSPAGLNNGMLLMEHHLLARDIHSSNLNNSNVNSLTSASSSNVQNGNFVESSSATYSNIMLLKMKDAVDMTNAAVKSAYASLSSPPRTQSSIQQQPPQSSNNNTGTSNAAAAAAAAVLLDCESFSIDDSLKVVEDTTSLSGVKSISSLIPNLSDWHLVNSPSSETVFARGILEKPNSIGKIANHHVLAENVSFQEHNVPEEFNQQFEHHQFKPSPRLFKYQQEHLQHTNIRQFHNIASSPSCNIKMNTQLHGLALDDQILSEQNNKEYSGQLYSQLQNPSLLQQVAVESNSATYELLSSPSSSSSPRRWLLNGGSMHNYNTNEFDS